MRVTNLFEECPTFKADLKKIPLFCYFWVSQLYNSLYLMLCYSYSMLHFMVIYWNCVSETQLCKWKYTKQWKWVTKSDLMLISEEVMLLLTILLLEMFHFMTK